MGKYDAILDHPRHVSAVHPQMSMLGRAAQFSPFAALTGYGDQITEAARLTDHRIKLTEAEEAEIGRKLGALKRGDEVELTWFVPDGRKAGGRYVTERVTVKQVVTPKEKVVLAGGRSIDIRQIIDVADAGHGK